METHELAPIPQCQVTSGAHAALEIDDLPALRAEAHSGHQWRCGVCGQLLIDGVKPGQVRGVALRCAACGGYNDATI